MFSFGIKYDTKKHEILGAELILLICILLLSLGDPKRGENILIFIELCFLKHIAF